MRANAKRAQRFDDDRQQRDALAADVDAEIELEPVVYAWLDLRVPIAGSINSYGNEASISTRQPFARSAGTAPSRNCTQRWAEKRAAPPIALVTSRGPT